MRFFFADPPDEENSVGTVQVAVCYEYFSESSSDWEIGLKILEWDSSAFTDTGLVVQDPIATYTFENFYFPGIDLMPDLAFDMMSGDLYMVFNPILDLGLWCYKFERPAPGIINWADPPSEWGIELPVQITDFSTAHTEHQPSIDVGAFKNPLDPLSDPFENMVGIAHTRKSNSPGTKYKIGFTYWPTSIDWDLGGPVHSPDYHSFALPTPVPAGQPSQYWGHAGFPDLDIAPNKVAQQNPGHFGYAVIAYCQEHLVADTSGAGWSVWVAESLPQTLVYEDYFHRINHPYSIESADKVLPAVLNLITGLAGDDMRIVVAMMERQESDVYYLGTAEYKIPSGEPYEYSNPDIAPGWYTIPRPVLGYWNMEWLLKLDPSVSISLLKTGGNGFMVSGGNHFSYVEANVIYGGHGSGA